METVFALDEAIRLIEQYEPPARPFVEVPPREAIGYGATEAPRGILFHRYGLDADGLITSARIVPPTSQNQAGIEDDLRRFVGSRAAPGRRAPHLAVRTGHPQLRPVYLLLHALPRPHRGTTMNRHGTG
nr:hypothetical protein GCM10020092_051610 [Actinoplanes digitatis]